MGGAEPPLSRARARLRRIHQAKPAMMAATARIGTRTAAAIDPELRPLDDEADPVPVDADAESDPVGSADVDVDDTEDCVV